MSVFLSPWSIYVNIFRFTERRASASRRGELSSSSCLWFDGEWPASVLMGMTLASLLPFRVKSLPRFGALDLTEAVWSSPGSDRTSASLGGGLGESFEECIVAW